MAEIMTYVIEKFYPYFWRKFNFPVADSSNPECSELVKKLREAVWVHRIVSVWHWRPFLTRNLESMVSSNETYVSYIFFMVSATTKDLPNIHESFMTSCSLVTGIAAYVYDKGYHEFLEYCPDILMILFEENYSNIAGRVQIWDYLRDHLITCRYSEAYDRIEEKTKGKPFSDVVNEPAFVAEIKELIKSKISVTEQAAVYRCTMKVIKRSEDRNSRNRPLIENRTRTTISIWTGSTQVELLRNTEHQRKAQSTQRTSDQFEPRDSVEDMAKKSSDVNAASATQPRKYLRVSETVKYSEAEQSSAETKTSNFNPISVAQLLQALKDLKIVSENRISTEVPEPITMPPTHSEKQLEENEKPCLEEHEKLHSTPVTETRGLHSKPVTEQSLKNISVIISNRNSSSGFEQSLECQDTPRMYGSGKLIAGLGEDEFGSRESSICPTQTELPITQDGEVPRKPKSEQSAKKIEVIDSDRIASYSENSLEALETPRILEDEQRISTDNEPNNAELCESNSTENSGMNKEKGNKLENQQSFAGLKDNKSSGLEYCHIDEEKQTISASERSPVKVEDTETDDLKAAQTSSVDQSTENVDKTRISTGNDAPGLEMEAFYSKALSQMEPPCEEDAGKPEIPEIVQTLAATEDAADLNSNQNSLSQSEQTLPSRTNEFLKLDRQRNISVQSSNCSNLEDDASRIEGGFATEDSDITKAKTANLEPQSSERASKKKKKKKTKSKPSLQDAKTPDLTPVKDSEPINLTTSSPYKEQSVQITEESRDIETSSIIPTKEQASQALLFLVGRLNKHLSQIYALLNISRDESILQT